VRVPRKRPYAPTSLLVITTHKTSNETKLTKLSVHTTLQFLFLMIYPFDIVRSQMFIRTVDRGQDPHQTRIFAGKQHELHQYGDTYTHRTGLISPKPNRLLFLQL